MHERERLLSLAGAELERSIVTYQGSPVGTVAARGQGDELLNYNQVFTRDFAVSAFAFLLEGQPEIVRNYLSLTAELQARDKSFKCFQPVPGAMPASFEVEHPGTANERLRPDFGDRGIGRITPVDGVFWWLIILHAYHKTTRDRDFVESEPVQATIRIIIELVLAPQFDLFPTLLVPDGAFMIDRRLGVYGHPLEIQVLFYASLRAACEVLPESPENRPYLDGIRNRLGYLTPFLRKYYWMDIARLNEIYRYEVESYGEAAANDLNVYPHMIPPWIMEWLPDSGGYYLGNLGPSRMDCRFFTAGNLMAILWDWAGQARSTAIMNLLEDRWDDLVGHMPIKVCYPALEGEAWSLLAGGDPKNAPWSYQNAGGWPLLLWVLTAAGVTTNRYGLVERALAIAERRLASDQWPEYYDGPNNRLLGNHAKTFQTWTIPGYIVAARLLADPQQISMFTLEDGEDWVPCAIAEKDIVHNAVPENLF